MLLHLKQTEKTRKWGSDRCNARQLLCIWDFQTFLNRWNLFMHSDTFQRALKSLPSHTRCALGMGVKQSPTLGIPLHPHLSLWLCIPTWILQLWWPPVMSRFEYSCNPCKAPFQVIKLYPWSLRAAVVEEGMPTFSCSFQAGSWRLGCRGRWCFQQLPVQTAALLDMYCKMGLLLAWEELSLSLYWDKTQQKKFE